MFSWCVGGGDVMCCDVVRYDVTWLVRRLDEVMRLAVS